MDPVTMTLMAASIGGGLLGTHKQKSISPEWLKQHFGAGAVTDEMVQLYNHVLNSPYGQQIMQSAAEQGQTAQNQIARNSAAAGMGPAGGADSGASIFSNAAAGGAVNALQREQKGNIYSSVMPIAQQMVTDRMNLAAASEQNRLNAPTMGQQFGGMLASGANAGLAAGIGQPARPQTAMLQDRGSGQFYPSTSLPSPLLANVQNPGVGYQYANGFRKPGFFSRLGRTLFGGSRFATSGAPGVSGEYNGTRTS